MQFVLVAYDGTDEGAAERRLAVRAEHLRLGKELHETGKWLYAAGILDDAGKMIGSMIVCDFPSKEKLQREWLDHEPYVLGEVWERIAIHRAQVPPFYLRRTGT